MAETDLERMGRILYPSMKAKGAAKPKPPSAPPAPEPEEDETVIEEEESPVEVDTETKNETDALGDENEDFPSTKDWIDRGAPEELETDEDGQNDEGGGEE